MEKHTLYATLIGINEYNQKKLSGCIKDVLDIDLMLRDLCNQQENLVYNPAYFLAPNNIDKFRLEDYKAAGDKAINYEAPTFKNISTLAFDHLKQAKDGDTCLLYYSGHGSQVEAPEVFWYSKPDRQNETIVCVDSRDSSSPEARDLIDKELAYLIWDALEGKNVHCLVIMDCCHSGNNLRGIDDPEINYRFTPADRNKIPFEQYLGYDKGFYQIEDRKAVFNIARYVHIAAARDSEKAQETKNGGLFTGKLTEVLRAGGTAKSYRTLVQDLAITIRNRAEQQNPVAFARVDSDLDLRLLGNEIIPYQPTFPVKFDFRRNNWILYGGAMHGLEASSNHAATIVRIGGVDKDIHVKEVYGGFSVLDSEDTELLDKDKEDYSAVLKQLASPALKIGISQAIRLDNEKIDELRIAYEKEPHLFFEMDFNMEFTAPDYLVQITEEEEFVLTRNNSLVPVFKREKDAFSFLRNVDAVGKWVSTSELTNAVPAFTEKDFVFTAERIEGEALSPANLDKVSGEKFEVKPGEEMLFSYVNGHQPAFRFNISLSPDSNLQSCFTGALYLESKFAIKNEFIAADNSRLVKDGSPITLSVEIGNRLYQTLPLQLDPKYQLFQINEITAFLKIFISNRPIDLQRFKQGNLELEDNPNLTFKGDDIGFDRENDNVGDECDWTVFTFKIRLSGPNKAQELTAGKRVDFSAFTVTAPAGLEATAFAVTGDDQQRQLQKAGFRGLDEEADAVLAAIMPPASIWGDALTASCPFPKGLNTSSDNGIQAIELLPAKNGSTLILPEGEEIVIRPKDAGIKVRSEEEAEETIIPFGYDEESGLYFPIGYTDEDGNIHITQLPPETSGRIQEGELTRSLGGSIKLFFRKIFRKKQLNKLVLYRFGANNAWEPETETPAAMKSILKEKPDGRVLLLIHGLTGDTRHMLGCLQEMPELSTIADFIITFDYENLATPMAKTADGLDDMLRTAGFGEDGMPAVSFIAHSQGGLVARWMVEKEGGSEYIDQLILVGVASAGSELAKLGSSVFAMITHALNVVGPIKYVLTGLSFLLKKLELSPGKTLKETNPGSDLLVKLSTSSIPAGVAYYGIGGDTNLLAKGYDGDDFFLKKVAAALVKNVVYPGLTLVLYKDEPNDMAVTIESMEAIPGFDSHENMQIVASNHLAYFREKICRGQLLTMLSHNGE